MTIVLSDGIYDTIYLVIGEIQRSFIVAAVTNNFTADNAVVQIRYASRYRRIKILFTDFANSGNWVYFSDDLAAMLGFEPDQHHWFRRANANNEIYAT